MVHRTETQWELASENTWSVRWLFLYEGRALAGVARPVALKQKHKRAQSASAVSGLHDDAELTPVGDWLRRCEMW